MSAKAKSNNLSLIMGGVSASIQAIIIFTSGSPYNLAHKISVFNLIPPIWIWCITLIIDAFLLGYAFGTVVIELSSAKVCRESVIQAYQGGMFFVATYLLSLAHYPLFFIQQKLLTALIITFIAFILSKTVKSESSHSVPSLESEPSTTVLFLP